MSALSSLSGSATGLAIAPAPAKPRARGFLHIVRHGVGPGSLYVLTYHRLESTHSDTPVRARLESDSVGPRHAVPALPLPGAHAGTNGGVILSEAKDLSSIDPITAVPAPDARPKPILAEGAQALIDLLERIGVDFHRPEVRGALEDILRLGSANIPDLWLSDDDLLAKGLAES